MSDIGTLAWARRTGGRLSPREQLQLAAVGIGSQLRLLPPRVAARLGLRKDRLARLDLDSVKIPDTGAAREAQAACEELPPSVAQHSHRTYLWGVALGEHDRVSYDPELLYVGSLLHDYALPGATNGAHECFTLGSARRAREVAESAGWDGGRTETLEEAIVMHFNPLVPVERGGDAHLLNAAAALDVGGIRAWELDPETKAAVVARHPRLDMKREITEILRAHARAVPNGRVNFVLRYGAFAQMIKYAPFDE